MVAASDNTLTHVLVVEDDPNVAGLISEILGGAGYRTTVASSYEEALSVAALQTIDLVISDVVLGSGGDGTDVLQGIRAVQPRVATLLVSGYATPVASSDDDAILAKPFTAESLISRVQRLLAAQHA